MLLETRKFDTASSAAGGEAATLGEIYDATFDSMRLVENANASRVGMERAYDARIDAIFNATGQRLRNPASTAIDHRNPRAGLDLEPFPDLHAEFQRQLEELATNRPEHRAIIAPDRPVIEDAYRRAREADRGFEETWERSSGGAAAWAARLTAGFAGTAADPINVFGLAAGPFGQAGRGTKGLLWMALKSGAANAGVEAAVQPFSQAWRAEAGLPHGLDMAALSIGAAFLFGAGLDAGARSTARGVRRLAGRPYLGPDPKADPIAALDAAARNAPEGSLIRRAVEGDEAAMKEIAVKTGLDADPAVRGALTEMETDGLFRGMKPEAVDDGEHLRQLSTALGRAQGGEGRLPPGEAIVAPPARPAPDMGDYAPAKLGTTETLDGKPVNFVALDPERVVTDAATFQFKSEGDAAGVTARLRGVKRWDPLSAGKSFVFERLNGELVIADGHQRLGLARRLADQKPQLHAYLFREVDGWTPADVRAHAALKNMRELSGTSVDMAKVMRERPDLVDDSLPLSDGKMREAAMLAKLSPEAFGAVVAGRLPATYAALIGDHVRDATRHTGLLDELARADLANVTQARFFLAQLMELPTTTEIQITLFGEEAVTRTVMAERARVLDASLRALKGDKRIFGLLEREAGRIAAGGNVLDREGNAARAQNAAELAELIERLSTTRGVVATLLNDAATAVARGYAPALAARAFTRRIGDLLDAEGINGLLKAADEPPAGGRIDDPNGPEAKAQVDELQARQDDPNQEVMFALRSGPDDTVPYPPRGPFADASMGDLALALDEVPGWDDWAFDSLSEFEVRRLRSMPDSEKRTRLETAMNEVAAAGIHIELLSDDMRIATWDGQKWNPGAAKNSALNVIQAIAIDANGNRFMPVPGFNAAYDSVWRKAWTGRNPTPDDGVMFALPGAEPNAPRTNASGFILRLPFSDEWGDPRFNPADRERALTALRQIAGINVRTAPWETLVKARTDIGKIAGQLLYYDRSLTDEEITDVISDEVARYMYDKRHANSVDEFRRSSLFTPSDELSEDIADIAEAGRSAIEHLIGTPRNGIHGLVNYGDTQQPNQRAKPNNPAKIADKRGGFFFASARELANLPDSLFHQGGQAIINALEQAGVTRAEITHLGLKDLAEQKPVTRAAFEQLIADNEFQFRRKTSWLNPERSKRDYELGGTRAFTGPRIPGRGVYFERLMAFPKRLKGGGDFAPGHFQSPHWEEIMKGTWASWRGSVRDLPNWGKTVIGEEGQTDFMQGAFGRGDDWTGRRPRIPAKDYLALKKERSKFEAAQHSAYLEMVHIGQQIGLSWDVRRSLEGDLRSGNWEKMLSDTRSLIKDWGNADPGKIARQDAMDAGLDKIADIIARDPQYFAADATKKFAKTESSFTPASPLDQSYVRTMARDLLLHASKEDADAVAIATSETTNRIQANTTASAAHFYDAQMKPSLEKELRRITGDGEITLEKVELEKALGAPKREKPYTVWAAKLSPETRAKINAEGLPLFSLATFAPQPVLSRSAPSPRYAAEAAAMRADIDKAVSKMLPPSWRHEVRDTLVYGGRSVDGYADPYERIIYVSLAATDPLERTFEESGHALRAAGLIPAADYGILRAEGQRLGARAHFEIDAGYGETYGQRWQGAALEDRLEEEAIMQMIAAHARGKTFGEPSSAARRVLDRIVKFLRGVGELLRGRGFRTYEDVFNDMMSGRMARPQLPEIAEAGRVQAMRDALTATSARSADEGGDTSPAGDAMLSLGEGTPPPDIRDVINGAAAEGRLSREDAAALLQRLEALERHYRDNPAEAAQALRDEVDAEALRRQRLALLTREAHERVENFVEQYRDARGQADPAKATIALLEHHGQTPMPDGASSVVGRRQAIIGLSMGQMEGALHEFRRTWVRGATRSRARLDNMVREAFGEGTGDQAAAGFAHVWAEVAEELRQRFNAAGGHIGQLKSWGLPQHHDRRALLNAGMETWISHITPRLDLAAMRNALTGGAMTAADLRASLEYIWRNITADGWIEREPSMARFGTGMVANQRADHRFLHFRNADAWLEYQSEFGGGADPFAAMMGHIRGMAEDIAAMEILGPNPRGMLTWLQQFTLQQAALRASGQPAHFPAVAEITGRRMAAAGNWLTTKGAEDYARNAVTLSDNMWDIYRGAAGAVVNQRIADTFSTVRNTNVASKLGGAALSAVTDLGFQKMARYFAGLPVTRSWGDVFRAFQINKRDAVRGGLILDTASNILHQEARWAGAMQGPEWSAYLADRVIASTGLAAWTQAGKHAFGLSVQAELASRAGEAFADLPQGLRRLFSRYGLVAADWDAMRAMAAGDPDFLTPQMVQGSGAPNLGERYLEMILQETEYAVPTGGLKAQALSYGGLRRGVARDEFWRSAGQFKMFGLSVAMLQGQRIAAEIIQNGGWRGAGYAAGLMITTTLYGALAIQLKELAKGRDPREMTDTKFWGHAILQSGGLGIYGDFLFAETNRVGGGLARTLVGPTADVAAGVLALGPGNAAQWLRGEKTNTGREIARFLAQNTPGGSNWYLRLAYERVLLENLQRLADPEANAAFRRKIQMQKRDYGNEFFWAPGRDAPSRGPELGRAFGGR